MTNTAVIVGINGFLGVHIAREFYADGWSVVGVDRVDTVSDDLPNGVLYHQLELPGQSLASLLRQHAPCVCVHAAGSASVSQSVEGPKSDFYSNTVVTFDLLETLRLHAPDIRFILLSSAAVYGNPKCLPIKGPDGPISPYGYHKRLSDVLAEEFYTVYGLPTCSVRIFSGYGPGLRRQVMWDICRKATQGRVVSLWGTGDESRDFVHAVDIAKAIVRVAARADLRGETYNTGTGQETPIRYLAQQLTALDLGCQVHFTRHSRIGDPARWCADISRISRLGYQPSVTVEDGVRAYADGCAPFATLNP